MLLKRVLKFKAIFHVHMKWKTEYCQTIKGACSSFFQKYINCPNITWCLPEKYLFSRIWGGGELPPPPSPTPMGQSTSNLDLCFSRFACVRIYQTIWQTVQTLAFARVPWLSLGTPVCVRYSLYESTLAPVHTSNILKTTRRTQGQRVACCFDLLSVCMGL